MGRIENIQKSKYARNLSKLVDCFIDGYGFVISDHVKKKLKGFRISIYLLSNAYKIIKKLCHSAGWHSTTFPRHKKEWRKALWTEKCCDGGSDCSGIFIFKISIWRRTFLRNRKKTAILNKIEKIRTTIEFVTNSCIRDRKITEPLIVAITHEKDLSDGYLWRRRLQWGEEKYHGTLPGHEI